MSTINGTLAPSRWHVHLVAVLVALAAGVANGDDSSGAVALGPHAEEAFVPPTVHAGIIAHLRLPLSRQPARVILERVSPAQLTVDQPERRPH